MEIKTGLEENKYYIPTCRERGCEGNLYVSINEDNFIIQTICEKNYNHKFEKLYFETFERFYLKEKIIQKCNKCFKILENIDKYECKNCNKIYCSSCFISDLHIQKDLKNLNIITNRCLVDQNELNNYCLACNKKVCSICLKKYKENNNPHRNHKIIDIIASMPTLEKFEILKEKINKKSESFEALIKSLNEWQEELNKKVEKLKKNLKNEIKIIKKLFLNFNIYYMDYYYYSNFHLLFNNIEDYNNKYLKTFMTENNFDKKTKCIFDFLTLKDEKPKTKCIFAKLSNIMEIGEGGIFQNFGDGAALIYSSLNKKIQLYIKSKDKGIYEYINDIDFDEKISSFNFSPDKTKIYVCLSDKKSINIINYNPKNNTLELCNEKIELLQKVILINAFI